MILKLKLQSVLGSSAELGVALVAVTALVVAGCGGGSKSSANTATPLSASMSSYINDGLAGNLISWNGSTVKNASGVTIGGSANASITTILPTSIVNTYASSNVSKSITLPASWVVSAGGGTSGVTQTNYILTSSGWTLEPSSNDVVANGNNFTYSTSVMQGISVATAKIDLSGQAVVCGNPMGSDPVGAASYSPNPVISSVPCAVATTYPAGATQYTNTLTLAADYYFLSDRTGLGISPYTLTDSAGVVLTTLPAVGTSFCLSGQVFVPNVGAAAGADNYSYRYARTPITLAPSCAAADIATALAAPVVGVPATALVANKATGVAGVNVLTVMSSTTTVLGGARATMIWAFHLGKVMMGFMNPAGNYPAYEVNKLAANAQLTANGFPVLP